jgi:PST family polysaccharide transporter
MAADFYPRLTASANDNTVCNRLVNEQALVGLLLAGPGAIGTLTFAPMAISVLYSARFAAAVGILRWICLGATLQVVTWPMGFIIMAKAKAGLLVFCELAWAVVSVGLAWICVAAFGLAGAGIAFFGSYIFHVFLIYPIVHRLSGFCWSTANKQAGLLFLSLIAVVFSGFYVLPFVFAVCIGTLITVLSGVYSIRVLLALISVDQVPRSFRRLLDSALFLRA